MYESDIYDKEITSENFPDIMLDKIMRLREILSGRSLIRWSEHCTECAYPECYKSCSLYSPREDGKCARFTNGFEKLQFGKKFSDYFLKIGFKRWGKLSGVFSGELFGGEKAETYEYKNLKRSRFIKSFSKDFFRKQLQIGYASYFHLNEQKNSFREDLVPDYFLIEYYYPGDKLIDFTLSIYPENKKQRTAIYNKRIIFTPGYNLSITNFSDIKNVIDKCFPLRVSLTPNNTSPEDEVYFGMLEFIKASPDILRLEKRLKCVVFDLDNTLWDGTIVEMNDEGPTISDKTKSILKQLDDSGVLLSIASKNSYERILPILEREKVKDYFLHPRINWNPKSHSIKSIAEELNLNPDSFLFVDDSEFERKEVKNIFAAITTIDSQYIELIPFIFGQKEEQGTKLNRRKYYLEEKSRKNSVLSFDGDYIDFLKSCGLVVTIEYLNENNYDRVFELTQRTNQLNYSGNIYDKNRLDSIQNEKSLLKFVISAYDKFGDYGIVGFILFESKNNTIIDMMFSCRIMGKKLESEVIAFIRNNVSDLTKEFSIYFIPTKKNTPAKMVLDEMNLLQRTLREGTINYYIEKNSSLKPPEIAKIINSG